MKVNQTDQPRAAHAFQWRALISVMLTLSFLLLVVSGVGLWVAPPGRIANWTDWTIFGLRKSEWADLHLWFGFAFVVASAFHLVLNWRPLLSYFKGKLNRQFTLRREWLAAGILCTAIFAGTRLAIPPFSTLLAFTEGIRQSWEKKSERPPIPHAELLTLSELAKQADINLTNALARLAEHGIKDASPEIRMAELAKRNQMPAQRLYEIITAVQNGQGPGGSGGVSGGGAGGGFGRLTLTAFCEQEGIELQAAQARLGAKGIKFFVGQTLREIAAGSGYQSPQEILKVIRGK